MTERWLPVVGYEGSYEVSDHGRVRSIARTVMRSNGRRQFINERILAPLYPHKKLDLKHQAVILQRVGEKPTHKLIHRLVLEAFVGPCPDGQECCHNNDIADDNRLENLRWDTRPANGRDRVTNGLHHNANKTHCKYGHEFTDENTLIRRRKNGNTYRACRACDLPRQRVNYYRRQIDYYQRKIDEKDPYAHDG